MCMCVFVCVCVKLIKCKICIIIKIINKTYKIIHLLIKFIIRFFLKESHCSDTSNKYPDRSLNSIQSSNYKSKKLLLEETFSRPI